MGYLVETSGRLRLPESQEPAALTAARQQMLALPESGWLSGDIVTATLDELAQFAAACHLQREGDDLVCVTDEDGDPKWSEQATAFWAALAPFVGEGQVDFEGEDDERWSYVFVEGRLEQIGRNGWDGTGESIDEVAPGSQDNPVAVPTGRKPRTSGRYLIIGCIALFGGIFSVSLGGIVGWLAIAIGVYDIYTGLRMRREAAATSGPPNY